MQRFYIENDNLSMWNYFLRDKEIVNQLIKVLRVKKGDNIILFDGKENIDYLYEIEEISKNGAELIKKNEISKDTENKYYINLYQAIPNKLSKIEYIIQKWVETWISNFVFFRSERSQKLLLTESKVERLKKIMIEAVEQSDRNIIPEIKVLNNQLMDVLSVLSTMSLASEQNLVFHTENNSSRPLSKFKLNINTNLFVWPEWGWSELEVKWFVDLKFDKIHLGNRILRCETVWHAVSFYLSIN